ncbi:hypothetical protein [Deefgea salmonis]|jgi:hypothetical protein|uniref:Uncharacterized protein n=1 Tax=Deefgea salmonis TaxID=2875502 RepID=A0ABS8BPR6_9NEIS|nr:hypothetical protein [Deefgea salmonis]MCB5197594.1 hypothetical protein [Deefgea salmonis]
MQLKDAKEYFEQGFIVGFSSIRDPLVSGGYMLIVLTIGGGSSTLMTAKKEVKTFTSLDSVFSEVERIAGRCSEIVFKV